MVSASSLRPRDAVLRLAQVQLLQQHLEALAVLRHVDRVRGGAEDGYAGRRQRLAELQRRLPAILHDAAAHRAPALLAPHQGDHVLRRQRLEVKAVGRVVVGRHGFRVAVDHDGLEPRLAQGVGGVDAAIVELDALADAVRPAAEDDDLVPLRRVRLAGRGAETALIGRVTCTAWRRRTRRRRCRCACRPAAPRPPRAGPSPPAPGGRPAPPAAGRRSPAP